MTVFKTFLKILNKNKFIVIMYTVILILFASFNLQTADNRMTFTASKPDVLIINNDCKKGITKSLINYIEKNSQIIKIENNKEKINDALFYRDVNYIIYIPKNYREDFLNKKNPKIEIKKTGDYQSSFAEMLLERYLNIANTYNSQNISEKELITNIENTLKKEIEIKMTSKLDTTSLETASYYYNFANYSILAGCVYIICLILSSFKEEKIRKRTMISSMNDKKYNKILLLSNSLFAIFLWAIYVLISIILIGKIMFSIHGLLLILNSLIFSICALSIAFLIGTLIHNKNAINGIVNVIALGSSFLCGSFVPIEFLPDTVLKIAHILPSYYYINSNEIIKKLEVINMDTITPMLINMSIILAFTIGFILIINIITKRKNKIG